MNFAHYNKLLISNLKQRFAKVRVGGGEKRIEKLHAAGEDFRIGLWTGASTAPELDGVLAKAFAGTKTRFCLISFDSDWLYPTAESRRIVHALNAAGAAANTQALALAPGRRPAPPPWRKPCKACMPSRPKTTRSARLWM